MAVRELVELPQVAGSALSAVAAEARAQGLQVASQLAPAGVLGDRGLLERLAGNLVENAVRHNVQGGWLRVDTGTVGGRARLSVESSGPVVESDVPSSAESPPGIYFDPKPPQPGQSPHEIVTNYLEAMQATPIKTSVARQFLTAGAQETWSPEESGTAHNSSSATTVELEILTSDSWNSSTERFS